MTGTPIVDVGQVMPYMNETGNTNHADGSDFAGKFKNAMESQTAGNVAKNSQANASDLVGAKKPDERSIDRVNETSKHKENLSADKKAYKDESKKTDTKGKDVAHKSGEKDSDTTEVVAEAASTVAREVADAMGTSVEDVTKTMEELGLSLIDLLNPANMTDLVMKLSGNEDTVSLLTDANLYQTLETLQNFVSTTSENLMEELDLSQEALDEVLNQTEELMGHQLAKDEMPIAQTAVNVNDSPLEGMKDFKTNLSDATNTTMNVEVDEATGATIVTYQKNGSNQAGSEDTSKDNTRNDENTQNETSFITQEMQLNNVNQTSGTEASAQMPSFNPNAQEIADQIMESMKTSLKPEMTQLEMNLHPASLGNVRVNLTSANGQVTAQFIAQNETVRAAIESQVVQLTNQLEEQGVKIEAVEVTLASHQFENNSSQSNTGSEQSNGEQNKPKVGKIRRLNLGMLEDGEELEELDEADKIAADMMVKNGNTVDYMA